MATRNHRQDLRLARRAAAGKGSAWDQIIDLYGGRIFGLALQFSHDRAAAEDLTQDIFLRLFKNLRKYRGDVPLVAWTLRLSRNLCIDHYRRTRRERESVFLPEHALASMTSGLPDPREEAQRRELLRQIDEVLPELRENLALVVSLRDLQGLSYSEISALLDLPIGTLKSRLSRGRRQLIGRLQARHAACESGLLDDAELEAAPC